MSKKKKPEDLQEKQQLMNQLAGLEEKWKRALADYQNLEKRIEQQQAQYIRMASMGLIDKLLPVIDDLERAASHMQDSGIGMILKQFYKVLESEGVHRIEAEDKAFDPTLMECVDMTKGKKDQVIRVVQAGYQMGETVIRPAKVEVGNGTNNAQKND